MRVGEPGNDSPPPDHITVRVMGKHVTDTINGLKFPVDPNARGDALDTLTEPTLIEWLENGAVAGITLKETTKGFRVLVTVLWDENKQFVLITQRTKQPKEWSSLNRLVQHMSRFPSLPQLKLEVRSQRRAAKNTTRTRTSA